jgi:Tol biopolymer transport system component
VLTRIDDGTVALDTVVDADTQDNTVDLTLKLTITPPEETFTLILECLNSAGAVVFKGRPLEVTATVDSDGIVAEEVPLDYVGPGYDAGAIQIVDPITTVDFGDTVQLLAEVLDSSGSPLAATPIAWNSLNTQRATVTSPSFTVGLVASESQRGPVEIEAATLTGQTDTVTITVEAVPSSITIVSGNLQIGFAGAQLPQPLVVQVAAIDGFGVEDVTVDFSTPDGGSFRQASVVTDASGQASTTWVLGPTAGTQTATASVSGVGMVTFTATATSTGPTASEIVFWSDSGGGLSTGIFGVDGDGSNLARVYDPGTDFNSRLFPRWSPDRSRIAFGHNASGANNLWVMSAAGDVVRQVVNDISAFYPKWSPNGTHLGFLCLSGLQEDNCLIPNATGPITSIPINSYTNISSLAPANWRNGRGTAMWDPQTDGRLVFARDSTGAETISKFFTANYDGSNIQALSAPLDAGNGPLQVVGPMDWSSDGSDMVFAAIDLQSYWNLYIMNSDGSNLRALTNGAFYDDAPMFSPDGTQILFGRQETANFTYDLWIINSDGTNEHQITDEAVIQDFDLDALGYDWSPDGTQIVLNGVDDLYGWAQVYVVPSTVTAATYLAQRRLVGRNADAGSWLWEVQPAWRP